MEIVDRQPGKWFTDRASIEELARRQGVPGPSIDASAPAGYHLAKGKLCRLDGKIFPHLVYVKVYVNGSESETQGAEHIAGFQDREVKALIVTEQSRDAALRLARSVAAVI